MHDSTITAAVVGCAADGDANKSPATCSEHVFSHNGQGSGASESIRYKSRMPGVHSTLSSFVDVYALVCDIAPRRLSNSNVHPHPAALPAYIFAVACHIEQLASSGRPQALLCAKAQIAVYATMGNSQLGSIHHLHGYYNTPTSTLIRL